MSVRPFLRRFVRKSVFHVVPGAFASLVGAILFAQYWAQPQPPVRLENVKRVALQSEQIVQMIRDEHDLVLEFLKREQEREIARQPLSVKEMKEAAAAVTSARRSAQIVRDKVQGPAQGSAQAPAASAPAPAPLPPAVEVVAVANGPSPAPDPKRVGMITRIVTVAGSWTDKAIDLTGLRVIPALIRSIPEHADLFGGEFGVASGGGLIDASR